MDEIDAVGMLPDSYAKALLLERSGTDVPEMARRLGIEPEGVPDLLELAHRKLDALRNGTPRSTAPPIDDIQEERA
jgi:hypothetical protein